MRNTHSDRTRTGAGVYESTGRQDVQHYHNNRYAPVQLYLEHQFKVQCIFTILIESFYSPTEYDAIR